MLELNIICDKCREVFGPKYTELRRLNWDAENLIDDATVSEAWEEKEGKHLCPKCNGYYDRLYDEDEKEADNEK